jgi:hypothetical protein
MSYVDAGYSVVLGSLFVYAVSLVARERAARRRIPPARHKREQDLS